MSASHRLKFLFRTETGKDIQKAAAFLREGSPVAVPTETVYGLAGNALDTDSVLKIFEIKNRPFFDPLIVHLNNIEEVEKYTLAFPDQARRLAEKFWPGPLTLLLSKNNKISDLVTAGSDRVALRVPAHPLTRELLQALDFPLAAPSANPFGYISPTTAEHVNNQLGGKIPYILDGGPCRVGIESTIVGFEGESEQVVIYRPGGVSAEEIERCCDSVTYASESLKKAPEAPGMLKSHYAPKTPLIIADLREVGNKISVSPTETGIIAFSEAVPGVPEENQFILSPKRDLREAAAKLFAAMRQADEAGFKIICTERFPEEGLGKAINNRLERAAAKD